MPGPLRGKLELFCQARARGVPAPEAFVAAGYMDNSKTHYLNKLLKNSTADARIDELVASGIGTLSRVQTTQRLIQIADRAETMSSAAALAVARAALMDIARLNALVRPDETQAGSTKIMVLADRPLSEEEWESLHPPLG